MKILNEIRKKLTSFYNIVSGQFKKKQPIKTLQKGKIKTFDNVDEILDYAFKNNLKNEEIKTLIEILNSPKDIKNKVIKHTFNKTKINLLTKLTRRVQKIKAGDGVTMFDEKINCLVSGVEKCAVLQWTDEDGTPYREWIPIKFLTRVYKSKP